MIHYITTNGIGNAWVANELSRADTAGIPVQLHAMRRPTDTYHLSAWAARLQADTNVIYPLSSRRLIASMCIAPLAFGLRFWAALANACFGERESWRARMAGLAHFVVACDWARRLSQSEVTHIHSQWIHSCGTIGMYGAWLQGTSFSFTGHAADLFRERCALRDKIRRADFIVCISSFHRDFFLAEGARREQLITAFCGIDTRHFAPPAARPDNGGSIRIRSSGRLVEKKGFRYLIDACRVLVDRGFVLECRIAGSGPLVEALKRQIREQRLEEIVFITGEALKQERIPEFMHSGDVYCLPCVWASDKDVDGLPQMLMEAMACGLPAISTRLVGIPDLIIHEQTGLLVEPNDVIGLADAIERLSKDRALAQRLADAGRRHVIEHFELATCLEPLFDKFRERLPRRIAADDGLTRQPAESAEARA